MSAMAFQITSLTIVYWTVYSDANQRKHQSSASLVFVWGIHRGPVNSPHKWPVTRKMFPFHDVIMIGTTWFLRSYHSSVHSIYKLVITYPAMYTSYSLKYHSLYCFIFQVFSKHWLQKLNSCLHIMKPRQQSFTPTLYKRAVLGISSTSAFFKRRHYILRVLESWEVGTSSRI